MTLSYRIIAVLTIALLILPALAAEPPMPLQWPVYRGDAARTNRGAGGPPSLEALWRQSAFYELNKSSAKDGKYRLRQAEKASQKRSEPIIPASSPIVLTVLDHKGAKKSLLLYKNYFGVMAVDLPNGMLVWASQSNWSLQRMLSQGGSKQNAVVEWLNYYQNQCPQILFENSTVGALSTDGQFVYVVEDFCVPPPLQNAVRRQKQQGGSIYTRSIYAPASSDYFSFSGLNSRDYDPETDDAIRHNRLYALSLKGTGKLSWAVGDDEEDPLHDCSFLGPPLPLDGLLYVLIQEKRELSLLCIDPRAAEQRRIQSQIVFQKPLIDTTTTLLEDPLRRSQAAHLAYGEDILVCPTNAGLVLGVDLVTRRPTWVYPYREKSDKAKDPPTAEAGRSNRWKVTAPVIAGGKVVFTPPDDPSIHCLNLSDGALQWSRKKNGEDVYLGGVYEGRVLIVGARNVRALSLASGETLWTQETGLPTGEGIAAGNVYYLPLRRGAASKQPEVCLLDLKTGQVIAHTKTQPRTPKGEDYEVPGNLVFVEGKLISQSPWEIVAYPLLGGK